MCPIKSDIKIDHIVDFSKDHTSFAAARENSSGHLRTFLVNYNTGTVYARNGRAESWEELIGNSGELIRIKICQARDGAIVPIYKVNGSHNN